MQVFIEQVPFLFEAVESAGGFFLCGLFEGEEVFVGELLRHGWVPNGEIKDYLFVKSLSNDGHGDKLINRREFLFDN